MKNYLLLIVLTFLLCTAYAQNPFANKSGAKPEGTLNGKIQNDTDESLAQISVVLLKIVDDSTSGVSKEILVQSTVSNSSGVFKFENVPLTEKLKVKISAIGYSTVEMPVQYEMPKRDSLAGPPTGKPDAATIAKMMAAFNKDLGTITLLGDATDIAAVSVTGRKRLLEIDMEKKVFNVEKNIVSAGGTAIDVLRNMPSVQVDIDGNVKLRNASPTLFVDGRPTTLTLDQIPADVIEKVEIITNPSAKYDASGSMAGILNIVLKKNKKTGYNGMVNAGVDRLGGSNFMGSFNARQGKFNLSLTAMNMRIRNNTEGNSDRSSELDGVTSQVMQDIDSKTKGMISFGRLGVDYDLSEKTTISVAGIIGGGSFKPVENTHITNLLSGQSSISDRIAESERSFKPRGFQAGLIQKFATEGEELTADFNYFGGRNEMDGLYTTNYLNAAGQIGGTQIQRNFGNGDNENITFQIDYVKPFANGMKLETGARAQINNVANNNQNLLRRVGETEFENIEAASANYDSKNSVYAAYASLGGEVKDLFSYKAGLRVESSAYDGRLINTGETFSNRFPLNLFPSLFLSKKLSDKDQIQISGTRRVNRPNFFQLIPFVDYTDSLNITRGNADLVPEFTNSGELSYSRSSNKSTFIATVYYKHTSNLITRFLAQETNPITGNLDFINTYINANSGQNYGAEFTYTNSIKPWWDLTADLNFYNSKITVSEGVNAQDPLWTVFGKLNNNFNLKKHWTVQLAFEYQGKTNMPVSQGQSFGPPSLAQSSSQGYIEPYHGVDLAIKKDFLKNQVASVTLSANDIFATRGNTIISYGDGFSQSYYRLSNPRMIKLNFSYRFGKMDMNLFKRNRNANPMGDMQMQ